MKKPSKKTGFDPRDIGLESDSFVNAEDIVPPPGLLVNVEAGPKVGKTHFCIEKAPEPIVLANHDNGLRGVVEQFLREGKKIIVAGDPHSDRAKKGGYPTYQIVDPEILARLSNSKSKKDQSTLDRIKEKAYPMWQRSVDDYYQFLESEARTFIVDTGSAWFQLGKLGFHGMSRGVTSRDDPYGQKGGEMKAIFKGLVASGLGTGKVIIWIHRLKKKWSAGEDTGEFELDGYQEVPYEVEFTLRLSMTQKKGKTFRRGVIMNSRIEGDTMNGVKFGGAEDPPLDFVSVASYVTGTEESMWE